MKYLKINARHPECHGLARALIGSPCGEKKDYQLQAVFNSKVGWTFGCYDYEDKYFGFLEEIELPLDTLKLCPFMAMKEGVMVHCIPKPRSDGYLNDEFRGKITKIDLNNSWNEQGLQGSFSVDEQKMPWNNYSKFIGLYDIAIDLDNLPKGAEIVEALA